MLYIGQTSRFLKTRFTEHNHRLKKPRKIDNYLYRHFKHTNLSPSHISIQSVKRFYMMLILQNDIGIFSGMN